MIIVRYLFQRTALIWMVSVNGSVNDPVIDMPQKFLLQIKNHLFCFMFFIYIFVFFKKIHVGLSCHVFSFLG